MSEKSVNAVDGFVTRFCHNTSQLENEPQAVRKVLESCFCSLFVFTWSDHSNTLENEPVFVTLPVCVCLCAFLSRTAQKIELGSL